MAGLRHGELFSGIRWSMDKKDLTLKSGGFVDLRIISGVIITMVSLTVYLLVSSFEMTNNYTENHEKKTVHTVASNLSKPDAIAMDAYGVIYVSEYGTGSVVKIHPDGEKEIIGETAGELSAIYVDYRRAVYVADGATGRITRILPGGQCDVIAENLPCPSGMTMDRSGNLLVCCKNSGTIQKISGAGRWRL